MDGRLNNELKIEKSIAQKLDKAPESVKNWHANLVASRKTAATRNDYVRKVMNFLSAVDGNITEKSVTEYCIGIQTKRKGNTTVYTSDSYQKTVWFCLNSYLEYLVKHNIIPYNYIQDIHRPKDHDLERINEHRVLLKGKDFIKILNAVDEEKKNYIRQRDRAILMLLMNTGMRKTALVNITLDNLDIEKRELVVIDKGAKRHIYTINDTLLDALNEWLNVRKTYFYRTNDAHLFLSRDGGGIAAKTVQDLVKKYTKKALGTPLSPHKLRSGYCSILYEQTHDIEFVRRAVGHANVSTTQRYVVTRGDERVRASEIMGSIINN